MCDRNRASKATFEPQAACKVRGAATSAKLSR